MTTFSSSPPRTSSPGRGVDSDNDFEMSDRNSQRSRRSSSQMGNTRSPTSHRGDIQRSNNINIHVPTDNNFSDLDSNISMSNNNNNNESYIWGTNISEEKTRNRLKRFISTFTKDNNKLYPQLISDALDSETFNVNVNMKNILSQDNELYNEIINYPSECLPLFDFVVNEYAETHFPDLVETTEGNDIWVRPFNLNTIHSMRDTNPSDIDKLIAIRGMVIRCSNIIPDIRLAFFQCSLCNNEEEVNVINGRIHEPTKCSNQSCQGSHTYQLIHNRCTFQSKQLIKVQETPDAIPEGETPQTVDMYVFDNLVDVCKPGDRIELTGVYRASSMRSNTRRRTINSVYKTYIDCMHVSKTKQNQFSVEDSKVDQESDYFTSFESNDTSEQERQKKIKKIKKLAKKKNIYQILIKSLAPSVYQMDNVKKGLLCQLFGASNKDFSSTGGEKFRSQLNVLLCGDPGTSKSQLLSYVHKIAPRGIYTSGKGSSAVGLTAYITRDPDTKDIILESGALVLSDRGICCIDEFDKMSESARSILHEVMEQQTVSIAKAGIICTLNARTSILAAANPIESRYNPTKSVIQNIDLPPTLMSRFDLIYLILDRPNEKNDRSLAEHLVSMYYSNENDQEEIDVQQKKKKNYDDDDDDLEMKDTEDDDEEEEDSELLSQEELMDYITYSRKEINPKLNDDAIEELTRSYLELRAIGRLSGKKVVTATPRQLESLIRISEALARMKHRKVVTSDDVEEALKLHKTATLTAATNPQTGAINLDMINVGFTNEESELIKKQSNQILQILREHKSNVIKASTLIRRYNNKFVNNNQDNDIDMSSNYKNKNIELHLSSLKVVIEKLEEYSKVRASDWLRGDPIITIIDKSDL